ncbi:MAG: D-alanyl-D-alanine dipeptidase [Candidatus Pacebacteria bacterium]|nr:D-alanyl-D-alanine dipeptidase [Candidatus Paceibacterota bacterium]
MNLVKIGSQLGPHPVEIALAYATADNFTGAAVYGQAQAWLHSAAYAALERAADYAAPLGFRLRLLDAYRPTEAQWKLWNHTPDPNFLADPNKGSPHSRGVAIDLTLLTEDSSGVWRAVDMGTDFDAFTPLSYHGVLEISPEAQRNRLILLGIMTSAGWDFYRHEWWHYQLFNARDYPLISDSELPESMM